MTEKRDLDAGATAWPDDQDDTAASSGPGEESAAVERTERGGDGDLTAAERTAEDDWYADADARAEHTREGAVIGGNDWSGERTATREPADPAAAERNAAVLAAEAERLASERAARKEARLAALAPITEAAPAAPAAATGLAAPAASTQEAAPPVVVKRTTDGFLGSLGLFALRLVTAGIVGISGVYKLLDPDRAAEVYANTLLPQPGLVALAVGVAEVGIAIALVFGVLTRLAGLGLALIAGGTLAFVLWGPWSPFQPGQPGFVGDFELLLAAVGVLFLLVGAGAWSIDYGFRRRRDADRLARGVA